jgi:adenosine deaminase
VSRVPIDIGGIVVRRPLRRLLVSDYRLSPRAAKVLLHDHLDGGLRPQTAIELAKDQHYTALPTADAGDLAVWFHRGASEAVCRSIWQDSPTLVA